MELIIHSKYKKYAPVTVFYDECDHELISKHKWHISRGYAMSRKVGYGVLMHRLILGAKDGEHVDHINHNRADNRRENIRVCTRAENQKNRTPFGFSKYLGVFPVKNSIKFSAHIRANGLKKYLGTFDTEKDAALAYDRAARFFHGEFANPNFPDIIEIASEDDFKDKPKLNMCLLDILKTKETIKDKLARGDMNRAAKKVGKCSSCFSKWFARKRLTRADYENYTALMEVIEEREGQAA